MDKIEQNIINYIDQHLSANVGVSRFYHYSSVDALVNGITRDNPEKRKEVCLWATHCRYMNDPMELIWGESILATALKSVRPQDKNTDYNALVHKKFQNLFLISFSLEKDLLPMWNTYARKSTGVAIGFKRLKSTSLEDVVLRCVYDEKDRIRLLDDEAQARQRGLKFSMCQFYLPQLIKHDAYAYEKEVRFIGEFKDIPIKFREKNGYVIPYKEVFFSKDQIESITLGPCAHQEKAESSLRQLLDSRGLGDVKIIKSDIPYRNL